MTEQAFDPEGEATTGATGVLGLARRLVVDLAGEDVEALPGPVAGDEAVVLLAAAEALRAEAVRRLGRFEAVGGWDEAGATSTSSWLSARVALPPGEVRSLVGVARLARRHPRVAEALAAGAVPLGAARQLAQAVTPERDGLFARDVDVLVGAASQLSPAGLATALRGWRALADDALADEDAADRHDSRWASASPVGDGMVKLDALLDAGDGAALLAALDDCMAPDPADVADGPRTARQRRADALGQLAREHLAARSAGATGDGAPVAGIEVRVGLRDLFPSADPGAVEPSACASGAVDRVDVTGASDPPPGSAATSGADPRAGGCPSGAPFDPDARCEVDHLGPVPRSLAQRLCCDAWVGRIVEAPTADALRTLLGADGPLAVLRDTPLGRTLLSAPSAPSAPLDLGRRRRTFTAAQRRAIVARDRHCRFPGCVRPPSWCDAHHLDLWSHDGPTDVDNGALLCSHHHTVVHLRRWRPVRGPDGRWTFVPPTGARHGPRAGPTAA